MQRGKQIAYNRIKNLTQNALVVTRSASIIGPPDTAYDGGVFMVDFNFPANYPFKPPEIIFKTKIYHPNVETATGKM